MATYKVCYDAPRKIAFVLIASEITPMGTLLIGTFQHQGDVDVLFDAAKNTAIYDHAVQVLQENNIDFYTTRIVVTVPRIVANVLPFSDNGVISLDNEGNLFFTNEFGVTRPLHASGVTLQTMPGPTGASIYDIALDNGFVGSEAQFLASLKGETGDKGDPGEKGDPGNTGLSAYEVALVNGFVGTQAAWLASLVGPQGNPGIGVPTGGATGQLLTKTSNADYAFAWVNPPASGVSSFNSRLGEVTLTSADVTTALDYTPASLAGATFTGAVNFNAGINAATALTILGTATNQTLIIGGTDQTGAITIGRSTVGHTVNIANGVFSSGTQTVNIATGAITAGNKAINIATGGSGTSSVTMTIGASGTGGSVVVHNPTFVRTAVYFGPNTGTANGNVYLESTSVTNTIHYRNAGAVYGSLTGHKDVGLYLNFASHVFRNGDGSTEYARFNTSGQLGLGVTSPSERLDVSGNVKMTGNAMVSGAAIVGNQLATGTTGTLRLVSTSGVNYIQSGTNTSTTSAPLVFGNINAGVEWMRLTTAGNLGLGRSDPSERLDVTGNARLSGNLQVSSILTGNGVSTGDAFIEVGGMRTGDGAAYVDLSAQSGVDFNARVARYAGANGGMDIVNTGTGGIVISSEGNAPLVFRTSATERFRINGSGGITSSNLADAVGYKGLPLNNQGGNAYTLALSDIGKAVLFNGPTSTLTIPAESTVAFPDGASMVIINDTDQTRTIAPAADVTLVWAGGSAALGTRTMLIGSMATLVKVGTNKWYISGGGLS